MTHTATLHGLRVAVTGGTSGLGLALVRELSAAARASPSSPARATRVERVAAEHPARARHRRRRLERKEDIYPIAMQILGALGGLDVLVNNASDLGPGAAGARWPTPSARISSGRSRPTCSGRSG